MSQKIEGNEGKELSTQPLLSPRPAQLEGLAAERQLDLQVAERVMGLELAVCKFVWDADDYGSDYPTRNVLAVPVKPRPHSMTENFHGISVPDYSTEISAA